MSHCPGEVAGGERRPIDFSNGGRSRRRPIGFSNGGRRRMLSISAIVSLGGSSCNVGWLVVTSSHALRQNYNCPVHPFGEKETGLVRLDSNAPVRQCNHTIEIPCGEKEEQQQEQQQPCYPETSAQVSSEQHLTIITSWIIRLVVD